MLPASGTKLCAHFGNAYRAPALYQRFGTFFFGGAFSPLGGTRLSPERSVAFHFGADQHLSASRARVSATYFYSRIGKRLDVTADFQASGIAFTPMFAGTETRAFAFPRARKLDAAAL